MRCGVGAVIGNILPVSQYWIRFDNHPACLRAQCWRQDMHVLRRARAREGHGRRKAQVASLIRINLRLLQFASTPIQPQTDLVKERLYATAHIMACSHGRELLLLAQMIRTPLPDRKLFYRRVRRRWDSNADIGQRQNRKLDDSLSLPGIDGGSGVLDRGIGIGIGGGRVGGRHTSRNKDEVNAKLTQMHKASIRSNLI